MFDRKTEATLSGIFRDQSVSDYDDSAYILIKSNQRLNNRLMIAHYDNSSKFDVALILIYIIIK